MTQGSERNLNFSVADKPVSNHVAANSITSRTDDGVIHPPAVVEKYAPCAFIGVLCSGKAKKVNGVGKSAPVATDKGEATANVDESGETGGWRIATICQEYLW